MTVLLKILTIAMQLNPDYADAYNNRGNRLQCQKGDFDKAIEDLTLKR